MTELQTFELDLFKEFRRITEKYGLRYYAIGGTCIGAIRHQGFIPWDDDMDVAMPYEDYIRFIQICGNELKYPYSLYTEDGHPHWFRNFVKLQNEDTTFAEPECAQYSDRFTGVYLDIMPLFGMPKGKGMQWIYEKYNDYYHYMNRRQFFPYYGKLRFLNVVAKIISSFYRRKKNDVHLYMNLYKRRFGKYLFANSDKIIFGWRDNISNRRLPFSYGVVFDYEDFKEATEVPFEDTTISVPIGFDNYLTREFGDYMKLPPAEKRINHPTAIVDLNKPYKEYAKEMHGDIKL